MTRVLFAIGCAAMVASCSSPSRMFPLSPTTVVPVATSPTPPPIVVFQQPYTELNIGSAFQGKVDKSANPDCIGVPGFGCQYFRITPERDGMLDVELTWVRETQPNQGLDVSLESSAGEVWADGFGPGPKTSLRSAVKAGQTSQITLWYTFPGLEFTLQTALRPN